MDALSASEKVKLRDDAVLTEQIGHYEYQTAQDLEDVDERIDLWQACALVIYRHAGLVLYPSADAAKQGHWKDIIRVSACERVELHDLT